MNQRQPHDSPTDTVAPGLTMDQPTPSFDTQSAAGPSEPRRADAAAVGARESASHTVPTIVGIGASAGGLDASRRLIEHLPSHTGFAYVVVQHLDPEHESVLPELLGRNSVIPVIHVVDGVRLEADQVYVIPPNKTMTVIDGHLHLVAREPQAGPHLSIDTFFTSLAEVHGSSAIGVILSGAGYDGAHGIQAIKEAGGITFAQDGLSAHFPSMPQSAIDSGAIDFVLTPEEIAEQLVRLAAHLNAPTESNSQVAEPMSANDDEDLRKILALLFKRTGADFQHYRRGTLHRRILRRMLAHRQETRSEYLAYLRINPEELDILYEDLLIGVTRFFRDADVFTTLQTMAFPVLLEGHAPHTPIRIWVPGCATGQEAYSLAIALLEFLGHAASDTSIQVFGTDLSEASIAIARAGLYPATIAEDVSPERLRRFFVHEEGGYRITKAVRDLCVFSRQNVVRDPPFSHLDLVSCRNVLIYLEPSLQRRLFPIFHYALETNGLLLLGNAESVGSPSEYFEPFAKTQRIYQRRMGAVRTIDVDFATPTSVPIIGGTRRGGPRRTAALSPSPDEIIGEADRMVVARLSPPGVVINEFMEVLQFRGDTSGFLGHAPGKASLDLLKLARSELVMPLHALLRTARLSGQPVHDETVALVDGETVRYVKIDVLPFRPPATSTQFFVVLFTAERMMQGRSVGALNSSETAGLSDQQIDTKEFIALQQELAATKRYLRDIGEQYETTTEELRAANEEIQSSNEELQSTNEELETTKEEIQATNEELTTLNEELQHRNRDLAALSADLSNILSSTTIPILIVGADLRLRRFTPASERIMRVIAADVGRPLGDVKLRVGVPDLEQQIINTIETLTVHEQEVQDDEGRWWDLTIRPYQTLDRRVDGAVLVFADIDASKRYGERVSEVSETRRQLLEVAENGRRLAEDARQVAEVANKTKGTFLASMSHDLRTPLNAISGYTELLEQGLRGPVNDAQREDLDRIKRSSRYLLALINDILNFAKVEAGYLDVRMSEVPLGGMLAEIHEVIAPQLAAAALQFANTPSPVVVRADPEKLRQILLNLLTNAIKFTGRGGHIGIEVTRAEDIAQIVVWDTGRGIAQDQIANIFEPFVQIDRGLTTPTPGGVGLGLAISRDLARAMEGDLTVSSTLGEGSRFMLTLRLAG